MRQGPSLFQYRPHSLLEFRPGASSRHWPYEADTSGNSPKLFFVACCHTDRGVYQLMTQYRCDLHRHQIFGLADVRSDEDLKISIFAAPIIPALADVPAAAAAGGESNRDTKLRRQRSV
jgi:hypothetical protein